MLSTLASADPHIVETLTIRLIVVVCNCVPPTTSVEHAKSLVEQDSGRSRVSFRLGTRESLSSFWMPRQCMSRHLDLSAEGVSERMPSCTKCHRLAFHTLWNLMIKSRLIPLVLAYVCCPAPEHGDISGRSRDRPSNPDYPRLGQ